MLQCPYDGSHLVKSTRFAHHLIKCQRNHPDVVLNFCLFNENHLMDPKDAMQHFETCPDRIPHSEHLEFEMKKRYYKNEVENIQSEQLSMNNSFKPINNDQVSDASEVWPNVSKVFDEKSANLSALRQPIASPLFTNLRRCISRAEEQRNVNDAESVASSVYSNPTGGDSLFANLRHSIAKNEKRLDVVDSESANLSALRQPIASPLFTNLRRCISRAEEQRNVNDTESVASSVYSNPTGGDSLFANLRRSIAKNQKQRDVVDSESVASSVYHEPIANSMFANLRRCISRGEEQRDVIATKSLPPSVHLTAKGGSSVLADVRRSIGKSENALRTEEIEKQAGAVQLRANRQKMINAWRLEVQNANADLESVSSFQTSYYGSAFSTYRSDDVSDTETDAPSVTGSVIWDLCHGK